MTKAQPYQHSPENQKYFEAKLSAARARRAEATDRLNTILHPDSIHPGVHDWDQVGRVMRAVTQEKIWLTALKRDPFTTAMLIHEWLAPPRGSIGSMGSAYTMIRIDVAKDVLDELTELGIFDEHHLRTVAMGMKGIP